MSYIDLNSSDLDSVRMSSTQVVNKTQTKNNQDGGFLFSSMSKNDENALKAARFKNYAVVTFMVENDMIDDYGATDKDQSTLLHYIARDFDMYPNGEALVAGMLQNTNCKAFINKQDKFGNTPLILATVGRHYHLCNLLISHRADKGITNNSGMKVATDSEKSVASSVRSPSPSSVQVSVVKTSGVNPVLQLMSLLSHMNKFSRPTSADFPSTSASPAVEKRVTSPQKNTETDDFIKSLVKEFLDDKGNKGNNEQAGGKRNTVIGKRSINIKSGALNINRVQKGVNETFSSESQMSGGKAKDYAKLARQIDNQGAVVRGRVIEKIMEIKKVETKEANAIWYYLYHESVKEAPEMSYLDRAIELEKKLTKDFLEDFKWTSKKKKEAEKKYQESQEKKKKRREEFRKKLDDKKGSKGSKKSKAKNSDKSTEESVSDSGIEFNSDSASSTRSSVWLEGGSESQESSDNSSASASDNEESNNSSETSGAKSSEVSQSMSDFE